MTTAGRHFRGLLFFMGATPRKSIRVMHDRLRLNFEKMLSTKYDF